MLEAHIILCGANEGTICCENEFHLQFELRALASYFHLKGAKALYIGKKKGEIALNFHISQF